MTTLMRENRLALEASPYLRMHARNPVDWWPWCEAAFEEAKRRDVPVFLSSGYASCTWCHVMERESFRDEEVARLLNRGFVSIKLDREERPDVDEVYMQAALLLTGQGGWPLSVFMTPDKHPFFAGTYFPPRDRPGMPGFSTLLMRISGMWENRREQVLEGAGQMMEALREPPVFPAPVSQDLPGRAADTLMEMYDKKQGGFGSAPKFPAVHHIMFLMRYAKNLSREDRIWKAVSHTLDQMARGGMYDHVGGGFFRYSTDEKWHMPHFEKMLYDQGMMAMAYTEGWQATKTLKYAQIARATLDYALRELRDAQGGFFSAQSAESEGQEGKYYLWSEEEVKGLLEADADAFLRMYMPYKDGVLHLTGREMEAVQAKGLVRLFLARQMRTAPQIDNKFLLLGNGLMIAALAKCGRAMGAEAYTAHAEKAAAFAEGHLAQADVLLGSYCLGQPGPEATLDGYAAYVWGLIELYQATLKRKWLKLAGVWHARMWQRFSDEQGGLYFAAGDTRDIPIRPRASRDGAIPSGQAMAAMNGVRLSQLTGEERLLKDVERVMESLSGDMEAVPAGYTALMWSVLHMEEGGVLVKLSQGKGLWALERALCGFEPFLTVAALPQKREAGVPKPAGAWVCKNGMCMLPVTSASELLSQIHGV